MIWYRLHHGGSFCNIKFINLSLSVLSRPPDILVWVWWEPSHVPFLLWKSCCGGMNRSPPVEKNYAPLPPAAPPPPCAFMESGLQFSMCPIFATAPPLPCHCCAAHTDLWLIVLPLYYLIYKLWFLFHLCLWYIDIRFFTELICQACNANLTKLLLLA